MSQSLVLFTSSRGNIEKLLSNKNNYPFLDFKKHFQTLICSLQLYNERCFKYGKHLLQLPIFSGMDVFEKFNKVIFREITKYVHPRLPSEFLQASPNSFLVMCKVHQVKFGKDTLQAPESKSTNIVVFF